MWCVIPAAGRGSRLGPLTSDRPKALIELAGRPILLHLLDRLVGAASKFCLVVRPGGEVESALGDSYRARPIHYVEQHVPEGVGAAVRLARDTVRGDFMIVMGDNYYDPALVPVLDPARRGGLPGALLTEPVDPAADEPMGLVRSEDGRVAEVRKARKAGAGERRLAGLCWVPETMFEALDVARPGSSGELEIEAAIRILIGRGEVVADVPYAGWRRNVNTLADLEAVRARIRTAE